MDKKTYANMDVLNFYKSLPFNYRSSVEDEVRSILDKRPEDLYPGLSKLLDENTSVLEIGCGVGWLSNSINYIYKSSVLGIDFNPVAIARAGEVAKSMGLKTEFLTEDLFLFEPKKPFDIVISFGVLHHTDNCKEAIRIICDKFVRDGGHIVIGLYHKYGRQPFLDHFAAMKKYGASEKVMFERYRKLHPYVKDETQLMSWFRDQVLHPHETQHTLEEMLPILEGAGMSLRATSINKFQPVKSIRALIEEEKKYEEIAIQRLKNDQYFPGFFIFVAQKSVGE